MAVKNELKPSTLILKDEVHRFSKCSFTLKKLPKTYIYLGTWYRMFYIQYLLLLSANILLRTTKLYFI